MIDYLTEANLHFRSMRPISSECTECTSFIQGRLLEIAFPSVGCHYDKLGTCLMCDYGAGVLEGDYDELHRQVKQILKQSEGKFNCLLLCTNGSFLDERNLPRDVQEFILRLANQSEASEIIIETHVNTISDDTMQLLRETLGKKRIVVELGVESISPYIRNNCYNKEIDQSMIERAINIAIKHNIYVNVNLILGAPFLTVVEQLLDTFQSTKWAIEKGGNAIIFPMVIKPFTTLMYMYQNDLYQPISYWLTIKLLDLCKELGLEKINVSWIGPLTVEYDDPSINSIKPICCDLCRDLIYEFFDAFTKTDTRHNRELLLAGLISNVYCTCIGNLFSITIPSVYELKSTNIQGRHSTLCERLITDGIVGGKND